MSNNEINNLDPEDIGLKQIMGDRFHDETQPKTQKPKKPRGNTKSTTTAYEVAKEAVHMANEKAMEAQWEPVREPNFMDNLKACAKAVMLFGGLSCLIFYWQQTGLMAESIAVPSMCVCTALAGFGAGRNIKRGL